MGLFVTSPRAVAWCFAIISSINAVWSNHGLEGNRSCRWWEIYNNTFMASNNPLC